MGGLGSPHLFFGGTLGSNIRRGKKKKRKRKEEKKGKNKSFVFYGKRDGSQSDGSSLFPLDIGTKETNGCARGKGGKKRKKKKKKENRKSPNFKVRVNRIDLF